MTDHVSWEALNDFADGVLLPDARRTAEQHLASCSECAATLARLRVVLTAAADAPSSIDAPDSAWPAIQRAVESEKLVALPVAVGGPDATRRAQRGSRYTLVAAAVALMVVSSAMTALFMRKQAQPVTPIEAVVDPANPRVIPASVERIDKDYLGTVEELTMTLRKLQGNLSPETVKAVERSLKTIDNAINEARDALLRDPANAQLRELLTKHYQFKVDLLRRVSQRAT